MLHTLQQTMLVVLLLGFCNLATAWVITPPISGSLSNGIATQKSLFKPLVCRATVGDDNDATGEDSGGASKKKGRKKKPEAPGSSDEEKDAKKQELMKAVGEKMRQGMGNQEDDDKDSNLLDRLNPFKAGQNLRKTIDTALTSISISDDKKSMYLIDDRFSSLQERDALMDRMDYIPEVLVVGATGEVGRLVVKRLLLEGRFRVRVLVKDLYTKTLNMFGTGVTYCQGDLNNVDSLEYAVTDVDKIIFCTNPPRPDEEQFQDRFKEFMKETLLSSGATKVEIATDAKVASDEEWEELDAVLKVRAQLAEQVDLIGLRNILQAFQNVRHSDYGTSQAAKRSLFKFQGRPEDFNLFSLEDDADQNEAYLGTAGEATVAEEVDDYDDNEEYYDDVYANDKYYDSEIESRRDTSVKTQTQWIRNQFGHGVFVGRVPKATDGRDGGEASVTSSRLRSRQDPENGIDLGTGFAGFITRVCSDGGVYEAFVRTREYYESGIEYVCQFSTATKPMEGKNKSRNRFVTVRLPFESFKPVQRKATSTKVDPGSVPTFRGNDVRNLGFRYRSANNLLQAKLQPGEWSSFYLALSYIKLYRSQPEPEIVYLSDAKVPPVVRSNMVRHDARQLITAGSEGDSFKLLDESTLSVNRAGSGHRSTPEEAYYKYRGEEILRNSGLNYAIARVAGFNEVPTAETSTIDIATSNENITPLSRAEIAQVCVSALMDPNALNKSFYVTKTKSSVPLKDDSEYMRQKFEALPADVVA